MCGRFQLKQTNETTSLLNALKIKGQARFSDDIAPGSLISFIHKESLDTAIWWLLLEHDTHKPNYKYASFNSRSDKLNQSRSAGFKPFRESRCIIPASGFVEGLGDKKTYHKIELEDQAIAFGGLFKEHINKDSGEIIYSASIITLPPVQKWVNIHPKSIPLMLDYKNQELIDKWLDPDFKNVKEFNDIMEPAIHQTQRVTPIDKPSKWNPIGESYLIS
tara:strand:+ start:48841 stop:49497 length:657 start_codon:yes stop_codon:yes gene_type:complete